MGNSDSILNNGDSTAAAGTGIIVAIVFILNWLFPGAVFLAMLYFIILAKARLDDITTILNKYKGDNHDN